MIANFQDKSVSKELLYEVGGISRQAIWKFKKKQDSDHLLESLIVDNVDKIREDHPRMGSRQLFHKLKSNGLELGIGINKFEGIISDLGMTVGRARSYWPITSDGKGKKDYPNLANGLILNDINQLLVADITYYRVDGKWHYLFRLKDAYSQREIEIIASKNMKAENAVACIESAVRLRGKEALNNCIHHSDNGSQYEADIFKQALYDLEMQISRAKSCTQNGSSEQSHHICKNMYLEPWGVTTYKELVVAVERFKYLNNHERPIKQLGNLTPVAFEDHIKNIPLELRIQKTLYNFDK